MKYYPDFIHKGYKKSGTTRITQLRRGRIKIQTFLHWILNSFLLHYLPHLKRVISFSTFNNRSALTQLKLITNAFTHFSLMYKICTYADFSGCNKTYDK